MGKQIKPVKCSCNLPPLSYLFGGNKWLVECAICLVRIVNPNKATAIRMWNAAMREAKKG